MTEKGKKRIQNVIPQASMAFWHGGTNLLILSCSTLLINPLSNAKSVYALYWISGLVNPLPIAKPCLFQKCLPISLHYIDIITLYDNVRIIIP